MTDAREAGGGPSARGEGGDARAAGGGPSARGKAAMPDEMPSFMATRTFVTRLPLQVLCSRGGRATAVPGPAVLRRGRQRLHHWRGHSLDGGWCEHVGEHIRWGHEVRWAPDEDNAHSERFSVILHCRV